MDSRYVIVYATVNMFCLLTSIIIYSKFSVNVGSEREIIIFRKMTLCYVGFLLCELVWIFGIGGLVFIPKVIYGLIKVLGTFLIPYMVYYWFTFAEHRFKTNLLSKKIIHFLWALPIILLGVIYLSSFFTGVVFKIENGEVVPGPGYGLTGVVDNFYGIAIIVHALILLLKKRNRVKYSVYLTHIIFITICTLGGILDAIIVNSPILPLTIALSLVYLFINIQEPQIFNDALTGLNNRKRADNYLNDTIVNYRGKANVHIFMMDIDNFKQINDNLGHLEGDKALQVVAKALSYVTERFYRGFVARWGGDEFLMVILSDDLDIIDELRQRIKESIEFETTASNINYPLTISLGGALFVPNGDKSINDVIKEADLKLYEDKNNK